MSQVSEGDPCIGPDPVVGLLDLLGEIRRNLGTSEATVVQHPESRLVLLVRV
jgi:hypothetical protein